MAVTNRPGAKIFWGSKAFLTRRIRCASLLGWPQTFTCSFNSLGQKRMDAWPSFDAAYSNTLEAIGVRAAIVLSSRSFGVRAKYSGPDEFAKMQQGIEKRCAKVRRFMTSGGKVGKTLILKIVAAGAEQDSRFSSSRTAPPRRLSSDSSSKW